MSITQGPVGHLDADCFYASAERVRYEELKGMPFAVLGNQGACVIAKSYEMKAAGVGTGMPVWDARIKCPDGLFIKRDFRWYEILSRLMLAMAREFSPLVEYYSIDEFFFEAIPPKGMDHQQYAEMIRDRIMDAVGVPVTVGIARTKTLAKLISDSAKPFGARAVLDHAGEARLLASQPVTEIAGISGRREARLAPWGIATCLDLARADRRLIRSLLTASGEALWWELNGESVLPINPRRLPHKALCRGGSFGGSTTSPGVLYAWLVRHLERLVEELEYHQVRTARVKAWVAYRDGREGVGQVGLEAPSDRFDLLIDAFRPCLRRAWIPRGEATRMQLYAEGLTPRGASQLGLFDGHDERRGRLADVKRAINAKQGRFALRSGATLALREDIYRDPAHSYDICDVRGKACF
jgi:nucleotidyltransferase/DNA polymerase involved in DNA repair